MHTQTWLTGFAIASVLFFLLRTVRRAYLTPLKNVPGPGLARWTNIWYLSKVLQARSHVLYRELHDKYGPLVRIGPKKVIFNDTSMLKVVYGTDNKYLKSDFYSAFQLNMVLPPLPDMPNPRREVIFTTQDVEFHKRIKSAVTPAYALASIKSYEHLVDQCSATFLEQMHKRAGQTIDLGYWLHWYAYDVMGMLNFTRPFGFVEAGADPLDLLDQLHKGVVYATTVGQVPWLHSVLLGNDTLGYVLQNYTKLGETNPVDVLIHDSMMEYEGNPDNKRGDQLALLHRLHLADDRMSKADVVTMLFINVFAGSDTTTISMRALMYQLIKSPAAYEKLQHEIDEADAAGRLSEFVQFAEANEMPYLKAFIKESMRIFPSVSMPLERVVPPGGVEVSGHYLPAGTVIGAAASAINYDKGVFGADADTFRPERWIEASAEQHLAMERTWMALGIGSRMCIGRHIAMLQLHKLLPLLLREFKLEWASDKDELSIAGWWFARQDGLLMRLTPRRKKTA